MVDTGEGPIIPTDKTDRCPHCGGRRALNFEMVDDRYRYDVILPPMCPDKVRCEREIMAPFVIDTDGSWR